MCCAAQGVVSDRGAEGQSAAQRRKWRERGGEALLIARFAGKECAWQSRAMGVVSVDADNGDGRQCLVRARGQDGVAGGWEVGGEDVQAIFDFVVVEGRSRD
jgi:hypothetical protein